MAGIVCWARYHDSDRSLPSGRSTTFCDRPDKISWIPSEDDEPMGFRTFVHTFLIDRYRRHNPGMVHARNDMYHRGGVPMSAPPTYYIERVRRGGVTVSRCLWSGRDEDPAVPPVHGPCTRRGNNLFYRTGPKRAYGRCDPENHSSSLPFTESARSPVRNGGHFLPPLLS